jgi:hypothetical protein
MSDDTLHRCVDHAGDPTITAAERRHRRNQAAKWKRKAATRRKPNSVSRSVFRKEAKMKAKIKNQSLPIGSYVCTFESVEETHHEKYGDGLKWTFTVCKGDQEGASCFRTTKPAPTPKNSCGQFLAALAGKPPAEDLEVDTDDFIGCTYSVIIEASPGGDSTRIATFVPIDDESAPY